MFPLTIRNVFSVPTSLAKCLLSRGTSHLARTGVLSLRTPVRWLPPWEDVRLVQLLLRHPLGEEVPLLFRLHRRFVSELVPVSCWLLASSISALTRVWVSLHPLESEFSSFSPPLKDSRRSREQTLVRKRSMVFSGMLLPRHPALSSLEIGFYSRLVHTMPKSRRVCVPLMPFDCAEAMESSKRKHSHHLQVWRRARFADLGLLLQFRSAVSILCDFCTKLRLLSGSCGDFIEMRYAGYHDLGSLREGGMR